MKKVIFIILGILGLTALCWANPQETEELMREAQGAAQAGETNLAFIYYHTIWQNDPESVYKDQVLFALGEYYYLTSNYDEAERFFRQYLLQAEDSSGAIFARAYLFKFAEMKNDREAMGQFIGEILGSRQHTFTFRSHKEDQFHSPLGQTHKAVYAIDQVKFYSEGDLIVTVF